MGVATSGRHEDHFRIPLDVAPRQTGGDKALVVWMGENHKDAGWNWRTPNIVDAAGGRSLYPDRRYLPDPRRIRSRLNGPTGWVATYKNRKQYKAASSPPFKIGQNPRGACERK